MEVHGVLIDVQASVVSRVVDPGSEPTAASRLEDRGESVTAGNLARELVADAEAAHAQRTEFELRIRMVEIRISSVTEEVKPQATDPFVVDLDGDGQFSTTGVVRGQTVDVDADGRSERTSWVSGGDAMLVWDRNGNGRIDDGRELFGDQHDAADGIAELQRHDSNGDGRIDAADAVWSSLGLLRASGSVTGLDAAGFRAIDLSRRLERGVTTGGDRVDGAIQFVRADGSATTAADVWLARD